MALLSLRDIRVAFGGPPLLDGASLQIEPGDRICLLGRNGTGKSTLLRVVNGEIAPDEGEIVRQQGVKVALVPQEIPPGLSGTVHEVVSGGPGVAAEKAISRLGLSPGADFGDPFGGDAAPGADRPGACPGRGHPSPRRAHQPPGHRRHRLARDLSAPGGADAPLRHPRPDVPPETGDADRGTRSRETPRLGVRLRHVPRAPGGGPYGRKRAAGAFRQEARGGGNVDPPGREGASAPGTRGGCARWRGCARSGGRDGSRWARSACRRNTPLPPAGSSSRPGGWGSATANVP